ncbi:hypothetical protein CQA38_07375 [Campylobacter sp. MIT 12-5580]|uniref:hypothetical protein n=1 Tax=Campylobacter sp. MIT 12-5580 TaxID=2040651 RepID=UPI0010F4F137|nr:hypothetical protein [Campylobacter sp. MIT 12-5580]TKX28489.1 hypothetical protein CQA38_07375 [Campylobacter sp. MIT 12-5580]
MNIYKKRALAYTEELKTHYKSIKHFAKRKPMSFMSALLLSTHLIGALFFYAYFLLQLSFVPSLGQTVFMPLLLVFGLSGALFFALALGIAFVCSFIQALLYEKINAFKFGIFIALLSLLVMICFAKNTVARISGYGNFEVLKIFVDPRLKGSFECEKLQYCKEEEGFIELGHVKVYSALGDKYFIGLKGKDGLDHHYKIAKILVLNTLSKSTKSF